MYFERSRRASFARRNASHRAHVRFGMIGLVGLSAGVFGAEPVLAQGATRDLPDYYDAGVAFTATITIEPPPETGLVVVEDAPPAGWTVSNISDSGGWDAGQEKVKWGPFFGPPFPGPLTYDAGPPPDATGQHCFAGTVSFDVSGSEPIAGDDCIADSPIAYNPPVLPTDPTHQVRKNRYLSIDPSTNPQADTVIKVEVAEMRRCVVDPRRACLVDADCDPVCVNDLDKYCISSEQCGGADCIETGPCVDMAPNYDPPLSWLVQQPQQDPAPGACMKPGCPPYDPGKDNCCTDDDWIARLSDQVYVEPNRWQDYDLDGVDNTLLHIGDCPTVPCVTYHVLACNPQNLGVCSEPLEIATQRFPALGPFKLYADVAGGTVLPGPTVLPPDGYVSVKDLLVTLLTIENYGGSDLPQAHPTWVDMHGDGPGIPPNYILGVSDLSAVYVMSLTRGLPYVNSHGGLDPHNCP